jgi:hypothetical protein
VSKCDRKYVSNLNSATSSPTDSKWCSMSAQNGCAVAFKQFRAFFLTDGPTPKQGRAATTDCHFFRPYFAWAHAPSVHKDGIALEASAVSNFFNVCSQITRRNRNLLEQPTDAQTFRSVCYVY